MGDPRKIRKKYQGPMHPWSATRIEEEKALKRQYGTKPKRELWKMASVLKRFKDQAKSLVSRTDAQAAVERDQMVNRMVRLGLIGPGASTDDILGLSIHDVMGRRLQTVMVRRLLARSPNQARQMITHGHVLVGQKIITSPSYLVKSDEENLITFRHASPFANEQHPERFSEAELRVREEKRRAKEAKEAGTEEEAPLVYKEEDLEDPEEVGKKKAKKAETKIAGVKPEAEAEEPKPKAQKSEDKAPETKPAEKSAKNPARNPAKEE